MVVNDEMVTSPGVQQFDSLAVWRNGRGLKNYVRVRSTLWQVRHLGRVGILTGLFLTSSFRHFCESCLVSAAHVFLQSSQEVFFKWYLPT